MHRVAVGLILVALSCGTNDPSITSSDGDETASTEQAVGSTGDGLSASGGQGGTTASGQDATTASGQDDDDDSGTTQGVDDDGTTTAPGESTGSEGTTASAESTGDEGPNTTGNPGCGNGTVEPGEQCDGDDLQGFDCSGLGLGEGPLSCDPVMCTFDTSMCMAGGGTGFAGL